MSQFTYTAINKEGEKIKGSIDAPNESEVRVMLRSQNLRPLKIGATSALDLDIGKLLGIGGSFGRADVLLFTKQLSILISSGIPLVQGLEIITDQIKSPALKQAIMAIREKVTGGAFLWEALNAYRESFSDIFISMIRAGEAAGALDAIFKRLIKYLEDAEKLRKLVVGAMIYPIAIVSVGIIVVIIMMVFVIPKFEDLLKGAGQKLPAPTQFVINASHFFQHNLGYMIAIAVGFSFVLKRYLKTPEGRRVFDYYILKMPLFGGLLLKIAVARFARTMQTLLSSGINILDALEICRDAIGNESIAQNIVTIKSEVEQGKTLSAVMAKIPVFPSMVVQMLTVGESTGNVDKMLERIAEYYEEEVQAVVSNLSKLIEPLVLVFLGGMVGGLMIAMYLPIFQMAGGAN